MWWGGEEGDSSNFCLIVRWFPECFCPRLNCVARDDVSRRGRITRRIPFLTSGSSRDPRAKTVLQLRASSPANFATVSRVRVRVSERVPTVRSVRNASLIAAAHSLVRYCATGYVCNESVPCCVCIIATRTRIGTALPDLFGLGA